MINNHEGFLVEFLALNIKTLAYAHVFEANIVNTTDTEHHL